MTFTCKHLPNQYSIKFVTRTTCTYLIGWNTNTVKLLDGEHRIAFFKHCLQLILRSEFNIFWGVNLNWSGKLKLLHNILCYLTSRRIQVLSGKFEMLYNIRQIMLKKSIYLIRKSVKYLLRTIPSFNLITRKYNAISIVWLYIRWNMWYTCW